jgi:hypothetical protein
MCRRVLRRRLDGMNRHRLISLCVLALALLLPALALGAHRGKGDSTLKLTVTGTKLSEVDVPPLITSKTSPETPGDEILAVSRIGGAAAGRRYLACAVTQTAPSIEKALYFCQVTYVLAHGTITAAGVVHLNGTSTAAVTGGTGAYAGARGSLVSSGTTDLVSLL